MKAKLYLKTAVGIIFLLAITSCAPRPVFRLKAVDAPATWYHGAEYVQGAGAGVTLSLAYYRHLMKDFIIDLEVDNQSDDTLHVDPASFYYRAYRDAPTDARAYRVRAALDPEAKLLDIDKASLRAEARHRTYQLIDASVEVASLAAELASEPDQEEQKQWEQAREERVVDRHNERMDYHRHLSLLAARRQDWEISTLR